MPQDQANQISKLHIGVSKINLQSLEDAFKPDNFLIRYLQQFLFTVLENITAIF